MLPAMLVAALPSSTLSLSMTGMTVALAIGLPLVLAPNARASRLALTMACGVAIVLTIAVTWSRATNDAVQPRDRMHDGGVIVTEAAAADVLEGRNPYERDYGDVLPPSWDEVQAFDGAHVANPVRWHFPYLPAAALVHVPFVALGGALGIGWDTRILGCAAFAVALVAMSRQRGPAWARLGAVLGLGSVFSVMFLAWGTNDVFAASVALLALCLADRHPSWAGVLLAVALSTKLLLAVLLPPLALVIWLTGGWAAIRRWWTLPTVLVATCLPWFIADPAAFVDDTVLFNLGRSDVNMPTSGIGLPAVAPSFDGLPLAVVTVLGVVLALVVPLLAVRRWPSVWVAAPSAAFSLVAVLVPARTFQNNYLVLVAALLPTAWLALANPLPGGGDVSEAGPDRTLRADPVP